MLQIRDVTNCLLFTRGLYLPLNLVSILYYVLDHFGQGRILDLLRRIIFFIFSLNNVHSTELPTYPSGTLSVFHFITGFQEKKFLHLGSASKDAQFNTLMFTYIMYYIFFKENYTHYFLAQCT